MPSVRARRQTEALAPLDIAVPDNRGASIPGIIISTSHDYGKLIPQKTLDVECGGCGALVTIYVWSWAGGGKRCPQCHCKIPQYETFANSRRKRR